MGTKGPQQKDLWVPYTVSSGPKHLFYERLNDLLDRHRVDQQIEALCAPYFAPDDYPGRRSAPPGLYFRMLLIGYFEGIESERGICWRCEDSLSLRAFLGVSGGQKTPDHSTLSRFRTRLPEEVFRGVFDVILGVVNAEGLLRGKAQGVDSTYLQADASMKSIVNRDGEKYPEYIKKLAKAAGEVNPTAADSQRLDRKRKKKTSNDDWASPTDPDSRIARLKDGRTRLAYKAENVVDMDTGAILAAEIYPANKGDTATIVTSVEQAKENIKTAQDGQSTDEKGPDDPAPPAASGSTSKTEIYADKGYNSAKVLTELHDKDYRTYLPEPKRRGRRRLDKYPAHDRKVIEQNNARVLRRKSKKRHRQRGEVVERIFAHICNTGAARTLVLTGHVNVTKKWQTHAAAYNLGLVMRKYLGAGKPRAWAQVPGWALLAPFLLVLGRLGHGARLLLQMTYNAFSSDAIGYNTIDNKELIWETAC